LVAYIVVQLTVSRIHNYALLKANDCRFWVSENLELKFAFVLIKYAFTQVHGRLL